VSSIIEFGRVPLSPVRKSQLVNFAVLPVVMVVFFAIRIAAQTHPEIDAFIPRWDRLMLFAVVILLERIYRYRYAVSQRHVLTRDIISNIVTLYAIGFVTALLVSPVLSYPSEQFLGRKLIFAAPDQLGPIWLQIVIITLFVSFFRYWMHRLQHENQFLWELHAYHHRVTDLKATNTYVSHPIDYALRNIVVYLVVGIFGFHPIAILIAASLTFIGGALQHCGADLKGGVLNYGFITPEVHRWHHAAKVPEGYGYSCNYGVDFPMWDMLFGTFYLPRKDGQILQPERIGHPDGLPDEGNYLRLLLAPLGLWPRSWRKNLAGLAGTERLPPA
jgi:sterol desaturase/sphingolipid hydroxylase (fatty acid hydroxylase superfamily)